MSSENHELKKIILTISAFLAIVLLVSGLLLRHQMSGILGSNNEEVEQQIPVEDEDEVNEEEARVIAELPPSDGYTLRRNPTEYQIELFGRLVNAHDQFEETASDEDLKDYASAIVQNFVADFFTLSNKNSRTDIGGMQFFSEDIADNFRTAAIDDFYLYLNQHLEIFERESLPTVESTTILNVDFDTRIIEMEEDEYEEDEECEEYDYWGYCIEPYSYYAEEEIPGEEVRAIVVDIEWSYASSPLRYISEFQTEARFVLLEVEDEGVRIFQIEIVEEECLEYDYWGNCITDAAEEECLEFDYLGNCITDVAEEECIEFDYWGNCITDIVERECIEFDYWGNCVTECLEFDYWGNCLIFEPVGYN